MHINDEHPLNMRRAFPRLDTVVEMNRTHQEMRQRIEQAHPDSLALQQVQAAQYAEAFADLQRAIDRLSSLQARILEQAYANAPNDELADELARIGV